MTVITVKWSRLIDPQWGAGWWHRWTLEGDGTVCGLVLTAKAGDQLDTLVSLAHTTLGFDPICPKCEQDARWDDLRDRAP